MKGLTLENSLFMYLKGWFPIAGGFKSNKKVVNNKEILLAIEELSYAINRFNNADEDKIPECILEIKSIEGKLDKLYEEGKNDPLTVDIC